MNKDFFKKQCKLHRIKVTVQRLVIYIELSSLTSHPSAKDIFAKVRKQIKGISFDTVNRTLLAFAQAGLIRVVEGGGDLRRFDPCTEMHHHLRCIKCFRIIDFKNKEFDAIKIPKKFLQGFKLVNKKVVLEGLCPSCA